VCQAFLDYVHIMTRLPELLEEQADDALPDASQSDEIDELARSIPKLIGILPDVLRNTWDPRHPAALSVMIAGLVAQVDKVRPLGLVGVFLAFIARIRLLIGAAIVWSQVQPTLVDETTKLRHIHSMAYARFLKSIY
jgi:nuclear pore complex protein Nup98-Nup96